MCVNLGLVYDARTGLQVERPCTKCWQCVANRKNDWVGRCIAEEQFAARTTVFHLTYGGDNKVTGEKTDLGASILIYKDIQLWLKRLRFAGYPLRYFAVGEYGSLKGRSHWHVICFWQREAPPFENGKKNFNDPYWRRYASEHEPNVPEGGLPIGFTVQEDLRGGEAEPAIRYVLKYLTKTDGDPHSVSLTRMSKKPPLGAAYFRARADRFVDQQLLPQDALYSFAGSPETEYLLKGASLDYFLSHFVETWTARYGFHPLYRGHSELLAKWEDGQAPRLQVNELVHARYAGRPTIPPPAGYGAYRLWETRNVYFADPMDGFRCLPRLFWSFDEEGYPSWQDVIVIAEEAKRRRDLRTRSVDSESYRHASGGVDRRRTL